MSDRTPAKQCVSLFLTPLKMSYIYFNKSSKSFPNTKLLLPVIKCLTTLE